MCSLHAPASQASMTAVKSWQRLTRKCLGKLLRHACFWLVPLTSDSYPLNARPHSGGFMPIHFTRRNSKQSLSPVSSCHVCETLVKHRHFWNEHDSCFSFFHVRKARPETVSVRKFVSEVLKGIKCLFLYQIIRQMMARIKSGL